jgi:hypothetical protein
MTYNLQSITTVYYTLLLPGYMFRLLGVILRPSWLGSMGGLRMTPTSQNM